MEGGYAGLDSGHGAIPRVFKLDLDSYERYFWILHRSPGLFGLTFKVPYSISIENWRFGVLESKYYMEICLTWIRSDFRIIGNRSNTHSNVKSYVLACFLFYKLLAQETLTIQFQISTSSKKSRTGAAFKMCSRSCEYGSFKYHQQLLASKVELWISKQMKSDVWQFLGGAPTTLPPAENIPGMFSVGRT